MPKKKEVLSDAERAKRIREAANQAVVDNDPASFERAFDAVAIGVHKSQKKEKK